jgi:hypothetical protein
MNPEFVVFWVVAPYSVVAGYEHFGGSYCLQPEDGGLMVLRNVGIQPPHYTSQQLKKKGMS